MGLKAMLGNYNFPHKRTTITIQKKSLKKAITTEGIQKKSGKIKEESKKKEIHGRTIQKEWKLRG